MLLAALTLNLLILVPVIFGLTTGTVGTAFGPDTHARRILTCVYASIAITSAALMVLHMMQHPWAVPMTFALFAVQITYKLLTGAAVGLSSPVVVTNLIVVAVQIAVIAAWSVARG